MDDGKGVPREGVEDVLAHALSGEPAQDAALQTLTDCERVCLTVLHGQCPLCCRTCKATESESQERSSHASSLTSASAGHDGQLLPDQVVCALLLSKI